MGVLSRKSWCTKCSLYLVLTWTIWAFLLSLPSSSNRLRNFAVCFLRTHSHGVSTLKDFGVHSTFPPRAIEGYNTQTSILMTQDSLVPSRKGILFFTPQ